MENRSAASLGYKWCWCSFPLIARLKKFDAEEPTDWSFGCSEGVNSRVLTPYRENTFKGRQAQVPSSKLWLGKF